MFLKFFRCYTRFSQQTEMTGSQWMISFTAKGQTVDAFLLRSKENFYSYFFLRLKVKICTFFSPDRFTANGLPHCYSQTRVGEQGGRARALREVWFLFSSHNTRGLLLTPPASSKQVDLAASIADQLRACSQAQLKPSAEPDEGCSSLFQVLRQKRRAKEWERERFGFHS